MKLEDLGALIKAERKKAGLTQAQLARIIGSKHSNVSVIERGHNLTIETLNAIASALNLDVKIEFVKRKNEIVKKL
jgi:transcriptional regulator with XRE-family HTH domain